MSKADNGHITPNHSTAISRRSMLAGAALAVGAANVISPDAALAVNEDADWPEFEKWYPLMLEQEALFRAGNTVGQSGTKDDARHADLTRRMRPLGDAMKARTSVSAANEAIQSLLVLYEDEKITAAGARVRFLKLGSSKALIDGATEFAVRFAVLHAENVIRDALARNLLPGIKIYGDGGNA
jgi:hypothetical protein